MHEQPVSDQGTMADLLMKSAILFLLSFGVGSIALHAVSALPLTASKPRLEQTLSHTPTPDASEAQPDAAVTSPDGPPDGRVVAGRTDPLEADPSPVLPSADVAAVIFPEDPPDMPRLAFRPDPVLATMPARVPAIVPLPRSRPEMADPPKPVIIRAVASAAMPTIRQVATTAAIARVPAPPPVAPAPPPVTQVSAPPLPPPHDWRPGSDRLRHATLEALDYLHDTDTPLLGADLQAFAKMMNAYAEMRWQARGLEISERASVLDRRIVERTGELVRAGRITPNQFPRRARSFVEAASHTVPALAPMTNDLVGEPTPFRWW